MLALHVAQFAGKMPMPLPSVTGIRVIRRNDLSFATRSGEACDQACYEKSEPTDNVYPTGMLLGKQPLPIAEPIPRGRENGEVHPEVQR